MATRIGAHGRRVIEAIGEGRSLRRAADGWRAGALLAPDSLIEELRRHDLVREQAGRLALTAAGMGFTQRARRPEGANRLLAERALPGDGETAADAGKGRSRARGVTVNLAESPLGWLMARGLVSERQYQAGERLRGDWTIAGLAPRVTMRWDVAAPGGRHRRGPPDAPDPTVARIAARRRFDGAMAAAGAGLKDIAWRVACAGGGWKRPRRRWAGRAARASSSC